MRLATLTLLVASVAAVDMHLTTGDFHTYPGYAGHVHVEHGSVDFFQGEHDGEDAVHFQLELRLNDGMCGDYHYLGNDGEYHYFGNDGALGESRQRPSDISALLTN